MNATKRKFNALLQGIGTRQATNGSSTPDKKDASQADSPRRTAGHTSPAGSTISTRQLPASPLSSRLTPAASKAAKTETTASTTAAAAATSTTAEEAVSPATSAAVAELELLAKRRRVGTTPTLRDTSGKAATMLSTNSVLRGGGITTATATAQTQAQLPPMPRYCPGDREQLLRRLATFQELTDWTPKPDRISEIEWAKRGWACQGKERVRCTLCSRELVVRLEGGSGGGGGGGGERGRQEAGASLALPPLPEAAASEALADRYASLIAAAHDEDCLWRRKGCDDSLLRLPLGSPRQALAALRLRYDELCARRDFLPYAFNLQLPPGLDVDEVLEALPPDFFQEDKGDAKTPPSRVALALAVLGWQGLHDSRIGAVPNSASCHACLRRLGLWMFKSKQVDLATATVLEPAPMDGLDPVREHRFFCPWKNGAVQRNPGGRSSSRAVTSTSASTEESLPAWAVLVQVLRNDAYLRRRIAGTGPAGPPTASAPSAAGDSGSAEQELPRTPVRQRASTNASLGSELLSASVATTPSSGIFGNDSNNNDDEDEAARAAKDKERWARLRRVKSLFEPKGAAAKRLKRAGTTGGATTMATMTSRPGTAAASRPGTPQTTTRSESRAA